MPTTRAKKLEIARRREQVADMYICGYSQTAIADKLSVGQATVSTDLQFVQKEWRESRIRSFDAMRELEIRKLDRLEREAWAAWERSQKPSQSAEFADDNSNAPKKKRVKNQNGDPRFLIVVHQCIASRRALLGLDALPALSKEDINGADSTERSQRLISLVTSLREREGTGGTGAIIVADQSSYVRADSERGEVETSEAPRLLGQGDHGVPGTGSEGST